MAIVKGSIVAEQRAHPFREEPSNPLRSDLSWTINLRGFNYEILSHDDSRSRSCEWCFWHQTAVGYCVCGGTNYQHCLATEVANKGKVVWQGIGLRGPDQLVAKMIRHRFATSQQIITGSSELRVELLVLRTR